MIEEGSVIVSAQTPLGSALDVAPEGFAHPVYRCGFALSIALPSIDFGKPEDREVELAEALDEALKTAGMTGTEPEATLKPAPEPEPKPEQKPESLVDVVGHAPVQQEAPQTPFDEAPSLPEESAIPERLTVENLPAEETSEPEVNQAERARNGDRPQEPTEAEASDRPEEGNSNGAEREGGNEV